MALYVRNPWDSGSLVVADPFAAGELIITTATRGNLPYSPQYPAVMRVEAARDYATVGTAKTIPTEWGTPGAEVIPDWNFPAGQGAWTTSTPVAGSTITFAPGSARIQSTGGQAYIQHAGLVVGRPYLLTIEVTAVAAGGVQAEGVGGAAIDVFTAPGTYQVRFEATRNTIAINRRGGQPSDVTLASVSVKELDAPFAERQFQYLPPAGYSTYRVDPATFLKTPDSIGAAFIGDVEIHDQVLLQDSGYEWELDGNGNITGRALNIPGDATGVWQGAHWSPNATPRWQPFTFQLAAHVADLTPDPIVIPAVAGAEPNTMVTSAAFIPAGYDAGHNLTASAAPGIEYQVSLDGASTWGAFTSADTQVSRSVGQPFPQFRVRMTTAAGWTTPVTRSFTFGGVSANFTATTRAADDTPDAFSLGANVPTANPGAITVRTFVVAGIDPGRTITYTATGAAQVANGAGYGTSTTAQLGDTVSVRLTAGTYGATVTGGATSGGVSSSFSITSRAADLTPDAFTLGADATNAEPGEYITRSFTLLGVDAGLDVVFTRTGTAQVSVGTGPYGNTAAARLGATVNVRLQVGTHLTTVTGGATAAGVSASFSATARAPYAIPDPFTLAPNATGAEPGEVFIRTFVVTGIELAAAPVFTALAGATVATNTGPFGPDTVAHLGDTIRVRLVAGPYWGVVTGGVESGGVSAQFTVETRGAEQTVEPFDLGPSLTEQEPSLYYTAAPVTVVGPESPVGLTVTFGEVSINGGPFTPYPTAAAAGDVIVLRVRASDALETTVTSRLTIGGTAAFWSVTTRTANLFEGGAVTPDERLATKLHRRFSKRAEESLDFGFDWTDELVEGELITASEFTLAPGVRRRGTTTDDTLTRIWIAGGTRGETYQVVNTITTDKSRLYTRLIYISILRG